MQAFPNFGALTESIKFQRKVDGNWSDYLSTKAELIPETGSEVIKAESARRQVRVKFRMRFASILSRIDTREYRVLHGPAASPDTYNVTYIEDDRNRHVQMYVVCELEDR